MKWRYMLDRNLENLYSLIWGQCDSPLQEKLKTLAQYGNISSSCDSISLLLAIREVTFEHEFQRYQALQILEMNRKL